MADPASCLPCPNSNSQPESYVHFNSIINLGPVEERLVYFCHSSVMMWGFVLITPHAKCCEELWLLWLCYGCYGWKQVWKAFSSYVGITGLWHSCHRAPLMLHQCCILYAPSVIRTTMSLLSAVSIYGNKGPEIRSQPPPSPTSPVGTSTCRGLLPPSWSVFLTLISFKSSLLAEQQSAKTSCCRRVLRAALCQWLQIRRQMHSSSNVIITLFICQRHSKHPSTSVHKRDFP